MSLIYSAIKNLEARQLSSDAPPLPKAATTLGGDSGQRPPVIALCMSALVGVSAWSAFTLFGDSNLPGGTQARPGIDAPPPASVAESGEQHHPELIVAPAPKPENAPRAIATQNPISPAARLRQGVSLPRQTAKATTAQPKRKNPEGPPETDPQESVEDHIAAIYKSIAAGETGATQKSLKTLEKLLPEDSLTLLRLRAWNAQTQGRWDETTGLYQEILTRLPGDESASINLATVYWTNRHEDAARRIINELLERQPSSSKGLSLASKIGAMR